MRKGSDGDPGELAADRTSFGVGGGGGRVAGGDSSAWVDGRTSASLRTPAPASTFFCLENVVKNVFLQSTVQMPGLGGAFVLGGGCPGLLSGGRLSGGQMCVHRVGRRYVPSDADGDDTLHYDVMGAYFNLSGVTDGCACALPTNHFSGPGSVIGPVCVSQSVKNIRGGRINNKKTLLAPLGVRNELSVI